jgi:hypothetical protein
MKTPIYVFSALVLMLGLACGGGSDRGGNPASSTPIPTGQTFSVTQYGITWTKAMTVCCSDITPQAHAISMQL